jgi:hypothetical protein
MLFALFLAAAAADASGLTFDKVAQPDPNGPIYLHASGGDLDGDGTVDDAVIQVGCTGDSPINTQFIVSPRDAATGMASGKRMHKPMTVIKDWGAVTPELAAIKPTYDIKTIKGARVAVDAEGWSPITLENTGGLCEAARKATKTRSNIQNN